MDTAKILSYNPDTNEALVEFTFKNGASDSKFMILPTTSEEDVKNTLAQAALGSKTIIEDAKGVTPVFDPKTLIGQSLNISQKLDDLSKEV